MTELHLVVVVLLNKFSHTIHPDHSFSSPLLLLVLPPGSTCPSISVHKRADLQETITTKHNKIKYNRKRLSRAGKRVKYVPASTVKRLTKTPTHMKRTWCGQTSAGVPKVSGLSSLLFLVIQTMSGMDSLLRSGAQVKSDIGWSVPQILHHHCPSTSCRQDRL